MFTFKKINPFFINTISTAPRKIPKLVIYPPDNAVPPIIATANDIISQSCPVAGLADPILETYKTPAIEAKNPDNMWLSIMMLSVLIPENLAATGFSPTANILLPTIEYLKKMKIMIKTKTAIYNKRGIPNNFSLPMNKYA